MVKRLIPVNMYDTTTMEQWLSQMGEEGLILKSFSGRKAVFEDGDCQKIKYRIIPTVYDEDAPPREMKELFEAEGWHYVATYQKLLFVFAIATQYPKVIPFSREKEQEIYEELKVKKRNNFFLSLLGVLVLGGMQIFLIYVHLEDYIMGKGQYVGYTYILTAFLYLIGLNREYRSYKLVKEKLMSIESREELDSPYIPSTKWIRIETVLNGLLFIILFIPLLTLATEGNMAEGITKEEISIPYVTLEEIETVQGDRKYDDTYEHMNKSSTFLAPIQYVIQQEGEIQYDDNEIKKVVEVSLDLYYYELRFQALGDQTLEGLMEYYNTRKIEWEEVDQAWISEPGGHTRVFLLKDNKILQITYQGDLDISNYIDNFIKML
ncbi:hypothetical protein DSECCO2_224150 [anaerobic digester metagenome]